MRYALLFLLLLPGTALAQTPPSRLDSLRLGLSHYGLTSWQTAQNAATLTDWQPFGYGLTQVDVTNASGAFRRLQQPARHTPYALHSEGLRMVGKDRCTKWAFYGEFSYQKTDDRGLSFSHGYDPHDGNPYLWADTIPGDWLRDHVHTRIALAAPRLGRWRLGLTLPYQVGQGARLLDPKPFYRYVEGGALPSVWFDASARWGIGLVAGSTFRQEENEVGQFTIDFPLLYKFRGYGSFTQTPVSSAERRIGGTTWQGTLQARFRPRADGAGTWLGQVGGAVRNETIREGIADPVFGGSFTETRFEARLAYVRPTTLGGWRGSVTLDGRQGAGTDPLLRSVGASYQRFEGRVEAGRWQRTRRGFAPRGFRHDFLNATLHSFANNDQLTRTDFSGLGLGMGYDGLRRWERLTTSSAWFAGLRVGGQWFPSAEFRSLRPTFLTPALFRPDWLIQTTNHLWLGTSLGHDFGLRRFPTLHHRVELRADGQFTTGRGHRLTLDLHYQVRYL